MYEDQNVAFTLRVKLYNSAHDKRLIVIRVFDDLGWDSAGRVKLTCEVRHGGKVIFPRGQLYCALHGSSDGIKAKEAIMDLVGMAPDAGGGEGEDYYSDYTPEQIEWCNAHWEALGCERQARYCDENGNIKKES